LWGALLVLCCVPGCFRAGFPTARTDAGDLPALEASHPVPEASADHQTSEATFALDGEQPLTDARGQDACPDLSGRPEAALPDGPPTCPAACSGGCPGGTCVVTGTAGPVACPNGVDCEVDCLDEGACPKSVTCGTGNCLVRCGGTGKNNQCGNAINCGAAASCKIECLGSGSCSAKITCGAGPCEVVCGAAGTQGQCSNIVDCAQSCACDVSCLGIGSCGSQVLCPAGCDVITGKGCSSSLSGCQSC
jgi:hypothetical protein